MKKWWNRADVSDPRLDQLVKRVQQLEKAVSRGSGRMLYQHIEDYDVLAHPGVYRDANPMYDVVGIYDPTDPEVVRAQRELMARTERRVPGRVRDLLDKAGLSSWGDVPLVKASGVSWRDMLTPRRVLVADGAQILNTTTETIMCPDFTFAADYFEVGDSVKYTLLFDHSTVITTPGTHTFRLRWGGVGGTSVGASGAYAPDPTAASTTVSQMLEFWMVCRTTGATGSMFCMGRFIPNDFDDATATTLQGNLNMLMIPTSAPAATASLDTTVAKALSPTYASSVNTATTQVTNHIAMLESLN
jgi:hypothetical protein